MKYAIVILSGAADEPSDELDGRTPLEAADTPNLAALAARGRVGGAVFTPDEFDPERGVCLMSLLGADPVISHTGGAALRALGRGLTVGPSDRVSEWELLPSYAPVTPDETRALWSSLLQSQDERSRPRANVVEHGRALLIGHSSRAPVPFDGLAPAIFAGHETNLARAAAGVAPITGVREVESGTLPDLRRFREAFGLRAAMVTRDPVARGLAAITGLDVAPANATLESQCEAACAALRMFDLVCCDLTTAEEASLSGEPRLKAAELERIDRLVLGPLHAALERSDPAWRLLIACDRAFSSVTRRPLSPPVPFLLAGEWPAAPVRRPFTEAAARKSDLRLDPGHELMEFFVRGGLIRAATVKRRPLFEA